MTMLTITGYSDDQFQQEIASSKEFPSKYVAMLNPENVNHAFSISYDQESPAAECPASSTACAQTAIEGAPKYKATDSSVLTFNLIIDCTGIIDIARLNLKNEINILKHIIHDHNADTHRPNYVKIVWGTSLEFCGVLTNMAIEYNFFRPDGSALRAKVNLSFQSYIDSKTKARSQNNKSPDVTHQLLVRDGDNLPSIAYSIYRNPDYFIELAKANRLDKFRSLAAGTMLMAPPLKSNGMRHG